MRRPLRYALTASALLALSACATVPEPSVDKYSWPAKGEAYVGKPDGKRPYKVLGVVRSKVNFPTLTSNYDEDFLCQNYYRKAVRDLVRMAKEKGADAVIEVKSVTFLMNGAMETYDEAQCADDGAEGQVLAKGTAIRWLTPEEIAKRESEPPPPGRFVPMQGGGKGSAAAEVPEGGDDPTPDPEPDAAGSFGAD